MHILAAKSSRSAVSALRARGRSRDNKRCAQPGRPAAGIDEVRHRDIRYHGGSKPGRGGSMGTEMLVPLWRGTPRFDSTIKSASNCWQTSNDQPRGISSQLVTAEPIQFPPEEISIRAIPPPPSDLKSLLQSATTGMFVWIIMQRESRAC